MNAAAKRALILTAALTLGCATASKQLTTGAVDGLEPRVRQLTFEASGGVRDNLLSEETKRRVLELETAVVRNAADTLGDKATVERLQGLETALVNQLRRDLGDAEDSLLGNQLDRRLVALREELLGTMTKDKVMAIRDELLGPRLGEFVNKLVQDALGAPTQVRIAALREELVGSPLRLSVDALINQASLTFAGQWKHTIEPAIDHSAITLRNTFLWVLGGLLAATLGVMTYAFYLRKKYRDISAMLARHIESFRDEAGPQRSEEMKKRISADAANRKLETRLRRILFETGINNAQ